MIALTTNQPLPSPRNYLRNEPGGLAKPEVTLQRAGECFRDELSQMTRRNSPDLKAARRIESSLRYMMAHLNEPMRISMLSAMVGLSESCFFAHFKNATGHTPVKLLIRARMRWAGELLAEPNLQIKEIAGLVGYDDQYYFSRLFKLVHGLSPQHYRARKESTNEGK
jgi:transcriptional regulator GlxA family with amidase domain